MAVFLLWPNKTNIIGKRRFQGKRPKIDEQFFELPENGSIFKFLSEKLPDKKLLKFNENVVCNQVDSCFNYQFFWNILINQSSS